MWCSFAGCELAGWTVSVSGGGGWGPSFCQHGKSGFFPPRWDTGPGGQGQWAPGLPQGGRSLLPEAPVCGTPSPEVHWPLCPAPTAMLLDFSPGLPDLSLQSRTLHCSPSTWSLPRGGGAGGVAMREMPESSPSHGCQGRGPGEGRGRRLVEWARKEGIRVLGRGGRGAAARRQRGMPVTDKQDGPSRCTPSVGCGGQRGHGILGKTEAPREEVTCQGRPAGGSAAGWGSVCPCARGPYAPPLQLLTWASAWPSGEVGAGGGFVLRVGADAQGLVATEARTKKHKPAALSNRNVSSTVWCLQPGIQVSAGRHCRTSGRVLP